MIQKKLLGLLVINNTYGQAHEKIIFLSKICLVCMWVEVLNPLIKHHKKLLEHLIQAENDISQIADIFESRCGFLHYYLK